MDHLLVNLQLAGQHAPVLCIPHGAGGMMRAAEARAFAVRIARADDGDNDGKVWLHVVWHARGQVSAFANLRGASFMVADKPADIERWAARCAAHRASSDKDRSGTATMPLRDAVAMAGSLDRCGLPGFTPTALRTRYFEASGDVRWNGIRLEVLADRAIRDGMVLHSVSKTGGLHDVGLTPDDFAETIRQGYFALAVDPYDSEGNLRADLHPRILAAHVKQTPAAAVEGGTTCAA